MTLSTLRVHDGVLYEREDDGLWWPATEWLLSKGYYEGEKPDARVDPSAPLLCVCGSTAFNVKSPPGEYETSIRCVKCGTEAVVHDG